MKTKSLPSFCLALAVLLVCPDQTFGQELKEIELPKPQTDSGRALMQVLKERRSSREFSTQNLPDQVLSNMLWAAFGINRPDSGKRTAPSAMNRQEIDIYVATANGLYLYDAKRHALKLIREDDIRSLTGRQPFVEEAPVNLVYVADFSKMENPKEEDKLFYSAAATGFISENVYLYCSSEGLATVVRAFVDRAALAKAMRLRADQSIILAQSVGYPKKQ